MNTLIIVESYFGNTSVIARAIADGIETSPESRRVQIITAEKASPQIPADVSLVIVATPTHNYGLPGPAIRTQAQANGATESSIRGVREWIETAEFRSTLRIITIDTSIKSRFTPSTASKTARKLLKHRDVSDVERGPSFYVDSMSGPLTPGETERARAWGAQVAGHLPTK